MLMLIVYGNLMRDGERILSSDIELLTKINWFEFHLSSRVECFKENICRAIEREKVNLSQEFNNPTSIDIEASMPYPIDYTNIQPLPVKPFLPLLIRNIIPASLSISSPILS